MPALTLHASASELQLCLQEQALLRVARGHGGIYRLLAADEASLQAALVALESSAEVGVLSGEGGLLGGMAVAAQLALALDYGADHDPVERQQRRNRLQQALKLCGVEEAPFHAQSLWPAERLERLQRWRIGLALRLAQPVELLVIERPFAGLSRQQAQTVCDLLQRYQQFHPFRPLLLLELAGHDGPALPALRAQAQLALAAMEEAPLAS